MRCPKCRFVSSDSKDICPSCYLDLRPYKQSLGLSVSNPGENYEALVLALQSQQKKSPSIAAVAESEPEEIEQVEPVKTAKPSWLSRFFKRPAQTIHASRSDEETETQVSERIEDSQTPATESEPIEELQEEPVPTAAQHEMTEGDSLLAALDDFLNDAIPADAFEATDGFVESEPENTSEHMHAAEELSAELDDLGDLFGDMVDSRPATGALAMAESTSESDPFDAVSMLPDDDELDRLFSKVRSAKAPELSETQPEEESSDSEDPLDALVNSLHEELDSATNATAALAEAPFPDPQPDEMQMSPIVAPEVLEFGDDEDAFNEQLDSIIGDSILDVEAVKTKPTTPSPTHSDFDDLNAVHLPGEDMEITFEFNVDDEGDVEEEEEHLPTVDDVELSDDEEQPDADLLAGLMEEFDSMSASTQGHSVSSKAEVQPLPRATPTKQKRADTTISKNAFIDALPPRLQAWAATLEDPQTLLPELLEMVCELYGVDRKIFEHSPHAELQSLEQELDAELGMLLAEGNSFVQSELPPAPVVTQEDLELQSLEAELGSELDALESEGLHLFTKDEVEHELGIDTELSIESPIVETNEEKELHDLEDQLGSEILALETSGLHLMTRDEMESEVHGNAETPVEYETAPDMTVFEQVEEAIHSSAQEEDLTAEIDELSAEIYDLEHELEHHEVDEGEPAEMQPSMTGLFLVSDLLQNTTEEKDLSAELEALSVEEELLDADEQVAITDIADEPSPSMTGMFLAQDLLAEMESIEETVELSNEDAIVTEESVSPVAAAPGATGVFLAADIEQILAGLDTQELSDEAEMDEADEAPIPQVEETLWAAADSELKRSIVDEIEIETTDMGTFERNAATDVFYDIVDEELVNPELERHYDTPVPVDTGRRVENVELITTFAKFADAAIKQDEEEAVREHLGMNVDSEEPALPVTEDTALWIQSNHAPIWRRLGSTTVDLILSGGLNLAVGTALYLPAEIGLKVYDLQPIDPMTLIPHSALLAGGWIGAWLALQLFTIPFGGRSFGQVVFRLRTVAANGDAPTIAQGALRSFAQLTTLLSGGVGAVTACIGSHRTLHDRLSKTYVNPL